MERNPFASTRFIWIDSAIAKKGEWRAISHNFSPDHLSTYPSKMLYHGETIRHSAGIMVAEKDIWERFLPLYTDRLQDAWKENYAHDEETIIQQISEAHPHLFKTLSLS